MGNRMNERVRRMLTAYENHQREIVAFVFASLMIVFGVTMVLHSNGVAVTHTETVLDCHFEGVAAHSHDASCFDAAGNLVCPLPEVEKHTHTDDCYVETYELVCGMEEHAHGPECYDSAGNLVCGLPEHTHADACYESQRILVCGQDEVTSEHVHGPGCFRTIEVVDEVEGADDGMTYESEVTGEAGVGSDAATDLAEDADPESAETMPAQRFTHSIKDAEDRLVLRIDVDAPEGALPVGTTMSARWVEAASLTAKQQAAVADAVAEKAEGVAYDQQAVDVRFHDPDGAEVKPERRVAVTLTSALLDTEDLPVVAAIADLTDDELVAQAEALKEGVTPEEAEPERHAEALDRLSDEALSELGISLANNQVAVASDGPSTLVVSVTTLAHAMSAEGETVRVEVDAPAAAGLPADAELRVAEVPQGTPEWVALESDALAAAGADQARLSRFFDIKIVRADGTEVEPLVPVQVRIELADAPEGAPSSVVHFGDGADAPELVPSEADELATKFEAGGFSVWGVVYTEELHTYVISDGGDTYEVVVTYDSTAGIPEGAELRVQQVAEGDEAYESFRENAANNLDGAEKIPANPMMLDIAIVADGQEVEPAEGSEVKVEVRLVSGAIEGRFTGDDSPILVNETQPVSEFADVTQAMQVVHQAGDGSLEVMETEDTIDDNGMTSEFTTDSFSDWLLFLDEDLSSITVHEGDTLTLRPYTEWVWKQTDMVGTAYERAYWYFPNSAWNSRTSGNDTYYTSNTPGSGSNEFHSFPKRDGELQEDYTVVRSSALNTGEFDLRVRDKNNQVIKTIHVIVEAGSSSEKPTTVSGLIGVPGLAVNLFDYDVPLKKNQYNQDIPGTFDFKRSGNLDARTNVATSNESGNNGRGDVNDGHDLKILGYGGSNVRQYNNNGQYYQNYGWFWINNYTNSNPSQGIVKEDLGEDGAPELTPYRNENGTWGGERGNPSLKYLFDTDSHNNNVYAFEGADGLFQKDNLGYYYYNSNVNYAEYDQDSNEFILYSHTYSQNTGGSQGANAKPIGFFPFHEYDTSNGAQPEMNFNKELNHHFGMSMEVEFEIPTDRRAPDDDGYKHDIIYEFSGDDDLWVFIDDKLALDIGGIHQPVTGQINFTTGDITVHGVNGTKHMNFEVGPHTLKMFYIERGGCDSNLSVRFNLPLIVGRGYLTLKKKSADKTQNLSGAVFGVWDNPNCEGDPYTVATSDNNGIVFKDLPIRAADRNFYLQEMVPPEGYMIDKTIYTLTPRLVSKGEYTFDVKKDGQIIDDMEAGPQGDSNLYTVITNEVARNIEVGVQKVWEEADGTPLNDPDVESLEFLVKRRRTYTPENSPLINIRLMSFEMGTTGIVPHEDVEFDHIYAAVGDELTITYRHAPATGPNVPTASGRVVVYMGGSTYDDAFSLPAGNGEEQEFTYTVDRAHLRNKTIDLLVDKAFTDWCEGYYYANGDNPHFTGYGAHAHQLITEDDPDFEDTIVVNSENNWRDSIENLPVFERNEAGNPDVPAYYYYDYYVEEADVPEGYEVIYYKNGQPTTGTTSPDVNQTGDLKVVNRKLLDVPIEKEWANFGGDTYTWTAYFRLEQMEVKVNEGDPDASDAITEFSAVPDRDVLAVSKGQTPQPEFTGLPMYRVHSNGTVYRIIYSVDEIGFTVKYAATGAVAEQWGSNGNEPLDEVHIDDNRYAPIYYQDAGEYGSSIDDYEIIVLNDFDHRTIFNTIDLTVNKVWPQTTSHASSDSAYAKFVLRRYVHKEFRDYSAYDGNDWVKVTLDTGQHAAGEEHIHETIMVPRGTEVHITGRIKPNTNANSIVFTRSSGQPDITLTQNNPHATPLVFELSFTATADEDIIELAEGDNYVVGGRDGFRLTDTNRGAEQDEPDPSFVEDFTLNKANGWTKTFEYLPQIEESDDDPRERAQTIYVYSYYLEEVECSPSDFRPVFSTNTGVIGDETQMIGEDSTVTAANIQSEVNVTLRKVDKDDLKVVGAPTLEGAAFKLVKYIDDTFQEKDTSWGTNGEKVLTEKPAPDKGVFTVDKLWSGYYQIVETAYPAGYVQADKDPRIKVQWNSTTEELEILLLDDNGDPDDDNQSDMVVIDQTTITVGNTPGAELPHSGGRGVVDLYATGVAMVAGALAYLLLRRRVESA